MTASWIILGISSFCQRLMLTLFPNSTSQLSMECLVQSNLLFQNNVMSNLPWKSIVQSETWLELKQHFYPFTFWTLHYYNHRNISIWSHRNAGVAMPSCRWTLQKVLSCRCFSLMQPILSKLVNCQLMIL